MQLGKRLTDICALVFGLGAWLTINSLYSQLPILVQVLPEGWTLPSYLAVLIQIANIGPILYGLFKKYTNDSYLIHIALFIGAISMLAMAFTYPYTIEVFGSKHSVPLFILVIFASLVCCTSSLLFIPFMNHFPKLHFIPYMIGEGLSGLIPSLIALSQGAGGNPVCVNVTSPDGTTQVVPEVKPPNFSSKVFFLLIFSMMVMSAFAFFMLKKSIYYNASLKESSNCFSHDDSDQRRCESSEEHIHDTANVMQTFSKSAYTFNLLALAVLSAVANGVLPSIQSYSSLPYGNVAYHLSVNLSNLANPIAYFISYYLPLTSHKFLGVSLSGATIFTVYVLVLALQSPAPIFQHTSYGVILNVFAWVFCCGFISVSKLSIATILRTNRKKGLYDFGIITQVGSAIGAVVMFALVQWAALFKSFSPC